MSSESDWAETAERRVLDEALRLAPETGWNARLVARAGAAAGLSPGDVELLAVLIHRRASRASLDGEPLDARGEEPLDAPSRGLDLFFVSNHEVGGRDRPPRQRGIVVSVLPERRPPVEVEDRRPFVTFERREGRLAARRLRQAGAGRVEQRSRRDLADVKVVERELPVGCGGTTVERDRKAVGRPDLAEGGRRGPDGIRPEEANVDPLAPQEFAHELAVPFVTDAGDDRAPNAQAREAGGDVPGEAADEARVRTDLAKRRPKLVRIEIDADAAENRGFDGWITAHHSFGAFVCVIFQ